MSSKDVLCIFPEDITLLFLEPLRNKLKQNYRVLDVLANDESHIKAIETIKTLPDDSTIIFIGHGASHCLYGACNDNYKRNSFINNSNFEVFRNKNLFALSCRSSEFLNANKSILNKYLGFGNLPTDWDEILAERNFGDPYYLRNINEKEILIYKKQLATIVLSCFLSSEIIYDFNTLYFNLKLYLNKEITRLNLEEKDNSMRALANLWYVTKVEMSYYSNIRFSK